MGQQGTEGQYVVSEWEDTYQIVPVDATATELPPDLDVLAIVHPENLTPKLQFCDRPVPPRGQARVPRRRPVVALFQAPGRPGGDVRAARSPTSRATCRVLLGGWGIAYDPQKVVGDLENAERGRSCRDQSTAALPGVARPDRRTTSTRRRCRRRSWRRRSSSRRAASR